MALYPGVASHTVSQFDGRNLLWRSVIRYGTSKIWYGPLLKTLAVASLSLPIESNPGSIQELRLVFAP